MWGEIVQYSSWGLFQEYDDVYDLNKISLEYMLIFITRSKLYPNSDKHENEHQLFVGGPHCVSQSLKPPGMSGTAHDHNTQDKNNIIYEQICAYENVVTWPF